LLLHQLPLSWQLLVLQASNQVFQLLLLMLLLFELWVLPA
jgi:hypothetical protein